MNTRTKLRKRVLLSGLAMSCIFGGVLAFPQPGSAIDGKRFQDANRTNREQRDSRPVERDRSAERLVRPRPSHRWTLGVRGNYLQTGMGITNVIPGSPAWRVGLESKDGLVAVDGFQIGYVYGRLYDLSTELNLRADPRGWVRLLVWNHRNGQLVNVDVALEADRTPNPVPRERGIRGQVTGRYTVRANDQAVLTVAVVDITDPRSGRQPIAQQEITFTGRTPIPFHLDINTEQLELPRRYALQAYLTVNGRRVMANDASQYLLNQINHRAVEVALKPVRFDKQRP